MVLMRIDVVTIFPEMFAPVLGASILKRAQEQGLLQVIVHDLRKFTHDKRRTVDDRPYGGGPGMVMKPEPIFEAVEAIKQQACSAHNPAIAPPTLCFAKRSMGGDTVAQQPMGGQDVAPIGAGLPVPPRLGGVGLHTAPSSACETILMSPACERFSSSRAEYLAQLAHLVIICGHYEGVDERVKALVTRSVSIGDYVLTGGELPAMVIVDALARFMPGVIGHDEATEEESFVAGLLEYPQYTRPPVFRGLTVPEVLVSGDHERIAHWRKLQAIEKTATVRPDLAR